MEARHEQARMDASTMRSPSRSTAQQLLGVIMEGSLKPGDRLPAERALAGELGVGRSAVREAISVLEMLGIVETRGGSGTYLRSQTSELLPQTLTWGMLLGQENTEYLTQVRAGLEVTAIELALPHYGETEIEQLRQIVAQQKSANGSIAQFIEADLAFHQHIAITAANPVLADLLSTSRSLLRIWFDKAVSHPADMDAAFSEHVAILRAIEDADAFGAAAAMRVHMATATRRILRQGSADLDDRLV